MDRQSDLAAEGEPEKEFNPGIPARLPRKTAAGGALTTGHPTYTDFGHPR
ncbi:hypothetical protein JOF29_007536 [Kribbella aluminosa]|uniref:Uncharacterized protein n=1 Tax=Kribbella aluminosa TaxID=416017 RepID=A0ABS4UY10_9ACTN|nr:hypothetical protein [Kribbella aluminosa]MBP2356426.1 hypothetical protein [Kribbella aluminosa]